MRSFVPHTAQERADMLKTIGQYQWFIGGQVNRSPFILIHFMISEYKSRRIGFIYILTPYYNRRNTKEE